MNTPTGRPELRLASRRARFMRLARSVVACSGLLATKTRAAEPQLRVTGTLTIEASALEQRGTTVVQARLLDDAAHPVPGAELRIKPLSPSSSPPTARECQSRAPQLILTEASAYLVRSNDAGSVCVQFDGAPERAEYELEFGDPNGFYDPVVRRVIADPAVRQVEMAFAPAPSLLPLERQIQVLSLVTRPVPPFASGEPVEHLPLVLSVKRDGLTPKAIANASVELGSTAEVRLDRSLLGGPGQLEIDVDFEGSSSTRRAHTSAHATATAVVELSLDRPLAPSHPEAGVLLRVRVSSVAGMVPGGAVEARSAGVTLSTTRVNAGLAELNLRLEENDAKANPIELRYVPDLPWWLPGSTLSVTIPVLPPSPWRRFAWIAAVTALGSWLLLGWQRPRRLERAATSRATQKPLRAPIDVLEVGDPRSGWRGCVLDAHDGSPIPNANVVVRLPSFEGSGVLRTAQSDADGHFALDGADSAGPGAALEVRAPFHSPLAAAMPPPGTLVLSLISRRRNLLSRFVDWAVHEGASERRGEATPGEVAGRAERSDVAGWANAVDEAAFGPDPLSEAKEQQVVAREPPHAHPRKLAPKPNRA